MNMLFSAPESRPVQIACKLFAAMFFVGCFAGSPAMAAGDGEPCDTIAGRDRGQPMCDDGLVCTGPFEGTYGRGNCQKPKDQGSLRVKGFLPS